MGYNYLECCFLELLYQAFRNSFYTEYYRRFIFKWRLVSDIFFGAGPACLILLISIQPDKTTIMILAAGILSLFEAISRFLPIRKMEYELNLCGSKIDILIDDITNAWIDYKSKRIDITQLQTVRKTYQNKLTILLNQYLKIGYYPFDGSADKNSNEEAELRFRNICDVSIDEVLYEIRKVS